MRRSPVVLAGCAALFAVFGGAAAAPYAGKPPMIGGEAMTPWRVAFDSDGNRYVAGEFAGTADFDPGKATRERTAPGEGVDAFVSKFDKNGVWKWTQTFGGTGTDFASAIVATTTTVYVAGGFESTDAGFGGTGAISANTGVGVLDAGFVIALDAANGAPRTTFHGTGAQTFGAGAANSLALGAGTLFVGGVFGGPGLGIGGPPALNTSGGHDGFVAALDPTTGAARPLFGSGGVQTFGGGDDEFVRGVVVADGKVFVGGDFASTDFGIGGKGSLWTTPPWTSDAFVAALDATSGAPATTFGGDGVVVFGSATGAEEGFGLAAAGGVVYLAGAFTGSDAKVDGVGAPAPTAGGRDVFVLALDAATGARRTAFAGGVQTAGSPFDDGLPIGLAATASGVYLTGSFGGAGDGAADTFLAALDPATGFALPGFADDGVRTASGTGLGASHVPARILGVSSSADRLALVGTTPPGGTFDATSFPGGGAFLVCLDPADGVPLNMGLNRRPSFDAPLIASPNPVVAGHPVSFRAFTSDPDRDKLSFQWDWGDTGFAAGKAPKKTYRFAGTYRVRSTAADGRGGLATSAPLDVIVVPPGIPYFDVAKLTIALRLSPAPHGDSIVVAGQIPVPDGVALDGKAFSIKLGELFRDFVVNGSGRSTKGAEMVTMSPPSHGVSKFVVRLVRGDFAVAMAPLGLVNGDTSGAYVAVPVEVSFYGATYDETVALLYSSRTGRSGVAK